MVQLTADQYAGLKALAKRLERSGDGRIDVDKFLQTIDREVARGTLPPIFVKTPEEVWDRYRRELIHHFFSRWEDERYNTERRRIIGVHLAGQRAEWYEVVNGDPSEEARAAALMYYRQGVTLIGRYAKYTGKTVDEVLVEVREAVEAALGELVPA